MNDAGCVEADSAPLTVNKQLAGLVSGRNTPGIQQLRNLGAAPRLFIVGTKILGTQRRL